MDVGVVEGWLRDVPLPPGVSRRFDADGFWSADVSGAELTLGYDDRENVLRVYAPLFRLDGGEPVEFHRLLLKLQGRSVLPPGMMFALDEEDGCLALFGRHRIETLDGRRFEELLDGCCKAIAYLMRELPESALEGRRRGSPAGAFRGSGLSDEDLIRERLDRGLRSQGGGPWAR